MPSAVNTLQDVVDSGLCVGCGACAFACDQAAVELVDVPQAGIRPRFRDPCISCQSCLSFCPGYGVDAHAWASESNDAEPEHGLGPTLEIWQGHAADEEIRFKASSGGLLTAISLFCLEEEGMELVLHAGADPDDPLRNRTYQSRTRADLLRRTGSRYAPASPCDGLAAIEESKGPCVFVGKPCDASAVALAARQRPSLARNLGLVMTFFCAGTPSSQGTRALLASLEVRPGEVSDLRYRGEGWPGRFKVIQKDGGRRSLSYPESWSTLTAYRPFRCEICPDGTGRVADISCGDAWNRWDGGEDGAGLSVVLVRSERGRRIVRKAIDAGYVILAPVEASEVARGQVGLLRRRRLAFGRLLAARLLRTPTTRFTGFALSDEWRRQPIVTKLRCVLGTIRRLVTRSV